MPCRLLRSLSVPRFFRSVSLSLSSLVVSSFVRPFVRSFVRQLVHSTHRSRCNYIMVLRAPFSTLRSLPPREFAFLSVASSSPLYRSHLYDRVRAHIRRQANSQLSGLTVRQAERPHAHTYVRTHARTHSPSFSLLGATVEIRSSRFINIARLLTRGRKQQWKREKTAFSLKKTCHYSSRGDGAR